MMSLRKPDAEASRRAILGAAERCFAERGYAGTSMHEIAAAADVTQSLIHHYYGAKDALWREVRRSALVQYHARVQAAIGRAGGPSREAVADLFAHLAAHPHLLRLVAWVELQGETDSQHALDPALAQAITVITAAQGQGAVRSDLPAEHVLMAFMGVVRTWFTDRNIVLDERDPQAVARFDAAYVEAAWRLLGGGSVVDRSGEPERVR